MKIIEAVKLALPIFAEHKNSPEEILQTALTNAGISSSLAHKLIEFMPLAFARVLLEGMGIQFQDCYIRYDSQTNRKKQYKLMDETVYAESFWAASQIVARQAVSEAFQAIAFRSAELLSVNKALNSGSKPEDLVMSPPYMSWKDEDENNNAELHESKKKWQFWKK